ncbi:unnamed protein product [Ilex paraguariensis]|uniref:Exocyst subunit Exo70 family protein n=1 Tax=Ilex paraguariensis TaxID=185542 RepID=A0ABC8R9J8_9AQUA
MPTKGTRSVFISPSRSSSPLPSYASPSSSPLHTLSVTMMEENILYAESIIIKWDLEALSYSKVASLFTDDPREAKEFMKAVKDLQSAMHFFVKENASSEKLIRCQNLMQIAIKRLEKEFYQILSANRKFLDPESVSSRSSRSSRRPSSVSDYEDDDSEEDVIQVASNSVPEVENVSENVMPDLKAIADCMISSGYGKECVKIYKIIRRSIVDETLYHLGVEKLSFSQIQKMDWDVIERKIKNWLNAANIAVKTLFYGERILCDHVFSASEIVKESCFAEICKEPALTLFGFPEMVAKCKKSPEKMFRILDLYESISELWPEIESIFSLESLSSVRSQAVNSLLKLGEAVRVVLLDFEMAIQKESSKSTVPGGGVHPLTRYVMNYIVFLCDYSGSLSDIIADYPLSAQSPLPQSYFSSPIPDGSPASAISERLAWLILVLLCKLDGKAVVYKDVSLSYLFLANNLNYIVSKVRTSSLTLLLGSDWLINHDIKVKQYASNYERMGWSKVMTSLPENPTAEISLEAAKECFRKFNTGFEEAYRKQISWVIADQRVRDVIKVSVAKKILPAYRDFYGKYRELFRGDMGEESVVRYAPDDLGNYLSDLFYGSGVSGSATSLSSPPPSSSSGRSDRSGR